jgi:hypothetical protein
MDPKLGQPRSTSALREMEKAHDRYSATDAKEASDARKRRRNVAGGSGKQPGRKRNAQR